MADYIGYRWLAEKFDLPYTHFHTSVLGSQKKTEERNGMVSDTYPHSFNPGDEVLDHIIFGLKNEGLSLGLLKGGFEQIPQDVIVDRIKSNLSSKFSKKIGFLYEFLTQTVLDIAPLSGNYVTAADPDFYVLPEGVKDTRWKVLNNLPGDANFCPLVRRTDAVNAFLEVDFQASIDNSIKDIPPEIFSRAINYLYFKETKSSNEIEQEKPSIKREGLFVELLKSAGKTNLDDRLSEEGLTLCQNTVTQEKYNDTGFRGNQNYVGEANFYGSAPTVHLVGLPPQEISKTMAGFNQFNITSHGINPIVRAACLSFGFVFIHPFEDGNGRTHRFLFNDVIASDGLIDKGVILPVSAVMLKEAAAYESALEAFSKPLMSLVKYEMSDDEQLTVLNPNEVASHYQYPDLTSQVEYMFSVVDLTINKELINEFKIIQATDRFRSDLKDIADMPNRETELIIKLLYQENGRLSKTKRKKFPKLTEQEINELEAAYKEAFHHNEDTEGNKPG